MLSDKEIEEICKSAIQISAVTSTGIFISIRCIMGILYFDWDKKLEYEKRCKQWLLDNQQSYQFTLLKEDMVQ